MDWELSAAPYQPIRRRLLWRRRFFIAALVLLVLVPVALVRRERAAEPIGERLVDQIASVIAVRYYDPNFHGVDWRAVVARYRPLVADARSRDERYALLKRMVATLDDSHTAVFSPADLAETDPGRGAVVARTAARAGPAADDRPFDSWGIAARGVGYLRLRAFPDNIGPELQLAMEAVGRYPALVLDLRRNPGGLVDSVDAVAGMFLPQGTLISTGLRRFHPLGAQRFAANDGAGVAYRGRLAVIVDATTQSGAESLARALQFYRRGIVVGGRTAGKVLGVDVEIPLEDGGLLRVATLDMFGPDGRRLEGTGVVPDVAVKGRHRLLPIAIAALTSRRL